MTTENEQHEHQVPAWAKWALGLSQALILVLLGSILGWLGPGMWSTMMSMHDAVNINTYKLDQVQKADSVLPTMQSQIQQLQYKQADILQTQADHALRLQKIENDHGVRVKGWTH